MRVRVLSDLHLEFMQIHWRGWVAHLPRDCDVLVLAGDICSFNMIEDMLTLFSELFREVVYLPGNHEYYGSSLNRVDALLARFRHPDNVHILNADTTVIDGQRFVGCTMWFRYDSRAPRNALSDFDLIEDFGDHVYARNREEVAFLAANVRAGDVVVTHHLPSQRCVHPKYAGSPANAFFVCDVEDVIESFRPATWLHGHTHCSVEFMLGETRVVANPYGYFAHETNADFDPGKTIEV